jgi:hypothetical protein
MKRKTLNIYTLPLISHLAVPVSSRRQASQESRRYTTITTKLDRAHAEQAREIFVTALLVKMTLPTKNKESK